MAGAGQRGRHEGTYQVAWCDWGIVGGKARGEAGAVSCGQISKGLDHQVEEHMLFLVVNMDFSYLTKTPCLTKIHRFYSTHWLGKNKNEM